MFFSITNCPVYFPVHFSIPKSKYQWLSTGIFPCLSSPDMYCIVSSYSVYFRLKPFGKKTGKLAIL